MQPTLWDDTDDILTDWDLWQNAQGLSDRTRTERRAVITALLAATATTPRTLHERAIIRFCGRDGLAASSKATYHATIRAFCAWMIRAKIRDDDPTTDTPRPKRPRSRPRPLHMLDVQAVYRAANRRRTRAYIMLAILAGLRVHEIAKVCGQDFDLHAESLTVTGKGGVTELLPLAPELVELARTMPRHGYWFPRYQDDSEQHVTRSGVHAAIKRAMERAGVKATPHQLRHSYGTELLNAGANLRVVQDLMRHASIATTQGYTDVQWAAKRYAIHTLRLAA